jgi:hypothetical protein
MSDTEGGTGSVLAGAASNRVPQLVQKAVPVLISLPQF